MVGVEGAESRCPQIPLRWLPCGVSHTLQQREALAAGRWMGIDGAHWLPFCSRCWLWVGGAAATQQPGAKGKADGWLDGWLAGEIRQTACDAPVSDRGREPTGAVEKGRGDGVWMQRREKKGVAGSQGRKRLVMAFFFFFLRLFFDRLRLQCLHARGRVRFDGRTKGNAKFVVCRLEALKPASELSPLYSFTFMTGAQLRNSAPRARLTQPFTRYLFCAVNLTR